MVMGPTHAVSGAAAWLVASGMTTPLLGHQSWPVVAVGTAVCAGSALLPDIDCPGSLSTKDGSTVVRAFGFVGEAVGHTVSAAALAVYNLTKSPKDVPRSNGHRTLTHTAVFTVGLGLAVSAGTTLPGTVDLGGKQWSVGTLVGLVVMWACLHLALFGLCEKWAKRTRAKYGLLAVMLISAAATAAVATALPDTGVQFGWLGLAVGVGAVMHCLGDAITKMGVPFLWPIPIRRKRWYDVTLPGPLRIRAGGTFEYVVLLPALMVVCVGAGLRVLPGGAPVLDSMLTLLTG